MEAKEKAKKFSLRFIATSVWQIYFLNFFTQIPIKRETEKYFCRGGYE